MPGHVSPTVPVVHELVRRGHRVRYFTSDALGAAVAAAGAEVVSYGDAVGPEVMRPPRSFAALARETVALGRALLPGVLHELRADEPDLVVYDSMCTWGYEAVQYRRGFCLTATVALHGLSSTRLRGVRPPRPAPDRCVYLARLPAVP